MRLKIITLLVFLAAAVNPLGTYMPPNETEYLVPSNIRITNDLSEFEFSGNIKKLFSSFMRSWDIRGSSVAILREGRLVFAHGFGYADSLNLIETQPYHRFRIASVSKLITAVAIMKLMDEGLLNLDDRIFGVDGILNDSIYSHPRDRRVYSITVSHLLAHEGGWSLRYGDHMFITQVVAGKTGHPLPFTTDDYVCFALSKNLHFAPGKGYSYSNLGYAILSLVIEKVSGMSYEDYCRTRLFEPLGIYDMALAKNLESGRLPNEVRYYEHEDALPKYSVYGSGEMVPASYGGNDIESLQGAGAWVATAPDLIRLLLAIDGNDDHPDVISNYAVSQMTTIEKNRSPLGWKSVYGNGTWVRTGFFPGTTAMMKRMPDGTSWVVLMNSSAWNGPDLTNDINSLMNRIMSQIKEWPEYDLMSYSLPLPLSDNLDR